MIQNNKIVISYWLKISLGLIFSLFASILINFFIFRWYFDYDLGYALLKFSDFSQNPVFPISVLIIWLIVILIANALNSWRYGITISTILAVLWIFINAAKRQSRDLPFLPEDIFLFNEARNMTNSVDQGLVIFAVKYISLVIIALIACLILCKILFQFSKSKLNLPIRFLLIFLACSGLVQINQNFKNSVHAQKGSSDNNLIKSDFIAWNQFDNYHVNGPVAGFVYNIGEIKLSKPTGYSEASIKAIVTKYRQRANKINQKRQKLNQQKLDVVLILSESLADATKLSDYYHISQDPIPFMHSLSDNQLAVSEYGGGTANVEFEILTGLSKTLTENTTPYTHFLPHLKNFPSLAQTFKNNNFTTIALHDYLPEMYKRHQTYPNLGFDVFKGERDFDFKDRIEESFYISDQAMFNQIWQELEQGDDNKFIHAITMQNHTPYFESFYQNQFNLDKQENLDQEEFDILRTYLSGVNYSDQAFADFVAKLKQRQQPTVVILYGDHFPGSRALGQAPELSSISHQTPLIVFNNFNRQIDFKITSPNYVNNLLFDQLNLELSPFQIMLNDLQAIEPTLSLYHLDDDDAVFDTNQFNDYRLITYDLLNGQRFSQKYNFFLP